jgi:RNA polymerase subunit RPABC4/transcription elongation factor Spt4
VPVRPKATHDSLTNLPQIQRIESRIAALVKRGYCRPCSRQIATLTWSGLPRVCHDCSRLAERESARQKDASP